MFNPEHIEIYIEWNILLERKGADINPLETVLPRRDVLLRIAVVVKCQAEGTAQKAECTENFAQL